MMRLQKYLARSGVSSRRTAEKYILDGRIKVNGKTITELGTSVDETSDIVEFDGGQVNLIDEKLCLILNKPAGYVTSMHDEQGRRDVSLLVNANKYRSVFPVGRLDMNTRGLLLFTNDGELGNALMHPKTEIDKTYVARIKGKITKQNLMSLRGGIDIGDYVTRPCECRILESVSEDVDPGRTAFLAKRKLAGDAYSDVEITIHEGKNRQVRRMFRAIGFEVVDLVRVKYDTLSLNGLTSGNIRELNEIEILALRNNCIV